MKRRVLWMNATTALVLLASAGILVAQQPPPSAPTAPQPYFVGNRLGMPINPAPDGTFSPMSANVKVFGAIYSAESCSYDPARGVIVVPNRGVGQNVQTNNAWISFINHDGSVHTARWVGIQNPGDQRSNSTPPLVLNEPLGSDIVNGVLYLADRDGGTSPTDPAVSVIRRFNMQTGAPPARSGSRNRPASTTSKSLTTAPSTRRRRAVPMRRRGRCGRSRLTAPPRSSSRALRCVSPTASPSILKATSSSSTSGTPTC